MTNFTEVMGKMEELQQEQITRISAIRKEMQENTKRAFDVAFSAFFESFPEVKAFYWTQYSPYFNDGEECTFGVNDVYFAVRFGEVDPDEELDYDDEESGVTELWTEADLETYLGYNEDWEEHKKDPFAYKAKWRPRNSWDVYRVPHCYDSTIAEIRAFLDSATPERRAEVNSAIQSVRNFISRVENDTMEELFGNHVRVVVTAEGTEIDDYEHD